MSSTYVASITADLDPDLPQSQFDLQQIHNAIYNLVNNSVAATPRGGTVTIRTRKSQSGDRQILLEVSDTGCGMPQHVRQHVFTDETISTKPGGTGLGTKIVGGIVQRHSGRLSVASEEGEGTTVSVYLPMKQP